MNDAIFYATNQTFDGQIEDGWFFWDPTWSYTYGPYSTRDEAEARYKEYLNSEAW